MTTEEFLSMLMEYQSVDFLRELDNSELQQISTACWEITRHAQMELWRRQLNDEA